MKVHASDFPDIDITITPAVLASARNGARLRCIPLKASRTKRMISEPEPKPEPKPETMTESAVHAYISYEGPVLVSEVVTWTGASQERYQQLLNSLLAKGKIKKVGKGRSAKYRSVTA